MLLKSVILHYHGLDEEEEKVLIEAATALDALPEMKWANRFIAEDYISAFDRAKAYLSDIIGDMPKYKRSEYITMVWQVNYRKGYVTEMETSAIAQLAKDWAVQEELIALVKKGTREHLLKV